MVDSGWYTAQSVASIAHAVLAWLIWDLLTNLAFDVEYFWRAPRNTVKVSYFCSRYIAVLSQIINLHINFYAYSRHDTPPPKLCQAWVASQFGVLSLLILILKFILMTRLYALWDCSPRLARILGGAMAAKLAAVFVLIPFAVFGAQYGEACIVHRVPDTAIYLCILDLLGNVILFGLTAFKCVKKARGVWWWSIPILGMVMRDAAITFVALTVVQLLIIVDVIRSGGFIRVVFPLTIGLVSITTCRIIMDMRNLGPRSERRRGQSQYLMRFTSIIDTVTTGW